MSRLDNVPNGPNLNLLGQRDPPLYGLETLAGDERACTRLAGALKFELRFLQSNRGAQGYKRELRSLAGRIGDRLDNDTGLSKG